MFPSASVEALDLLRLCLQFNPNKRITAKDALRHPYPRGLFVQRKWRWRYVVQFHNPDDEFDCDRPGTMKRPKSSVNRLSQVVISGMPLRLLNDFSVREAAEAPFEFPSTTIRSSPSRTSRQGSLDVILCRTTAIGCTTRPFWKGWLVELVAGAEEEEGAAALSSEKPGDADAELPSPGRCPADVPGRAVRCAGGWWGRVAQCHGRVPGS